MALKTLLARAKFLKHLPKFFRTIWQAGPLLFSAVVVMRMFRALQPPLVLYVGKLIIDEIVLQTQTSPPGDTLSAWIDSGRLSPLMGWILLEFLLVTGANALTRLTSLAENILSELHGNRLAHELILQAMRLDLSLLETSEYQDKLQRARTQTFLGGRMLSQSLNQAQDIATILFLIIGLAAYAPGLILLLLIAMIPAVYGESHFNALSYGVNSRATPDRREMEYIRYIGSEPVMAKEIKLFGLGSFLSGRFEVLARKIHLENRSVSVRRSLWSTLLTAISALAYYLAYALVAWRTVSGELGVGDLTFLAGSLLRLNGSFEGLMLGFTQIVSNTQYLDDLFSFLDIEPQMVSPAAPVAFPSPLRQGVRFENVGFRYPGKDSWAIRNLSFSLAAGETVALVGENGAGKTTIVKLLARLYDPTEGRILIDGIDLCDFGIDALRDHVGVIFQDFTRYSLSASDNISVGRISHRQDRPRVIDAAHRSLADQVIDRLPEGYEQMLGRMFARGQDLSGGEWQRVAIARAYFRDADILILDEPTAALDARAEAEVFERFRNLSQEKTALLISHRFSTVRMADRILVMEHGAILEDGTHQHLLALDGRYAELFRLQAAGFQ